MKEHIGYKVVTEDLKSLGLRKNPTILTYIPHVWYILPEDVVSEGPGGWGGFGGIWLAKNLGKAKGLQKYMWEEHKPPVRTRIFTTQYDRILYQNSYRIKTNAILLLEEIK